MPPLCPPTPCREWTGAKNLKGYGWKSVSGKTRLIHRWVYSRLNGGFRAIHGKQVMHLCDNPPCYRYDHLWCGTNQDNVDDRTSKGRSGSLPGEANPNVKLTQDEVMEIRAAYGAGGVTQKVLAQRYGVSRATIWQVVGSKTWV